MCHWPAPEPAAAEPADVGEPDRGQLGVFISHTSEDKADVARPIAEGLEAAGWTVWLDQYELTVGDSLFQRINHGLARSRCGHGDPDRKPLLSAKFCSVPPQTPKTSLTGRSRPSPIDTHRTHVRCTRTPAHRQVSAPITSNELRNSGQDRSD
jgi:hypothetical protein